MQITKISNQLETKNSQKTSKQQSFGTFSKGMSEIFYRAGHDLDEILLYNPDIQSTYLKMAKHPLKLAFSKLGDNCSRIRLILLNHSGSKGRVVDDADIECGRECVTSSFREVSEALGLYEKNSNADEFFNLDLKGINIE